MRKMTFRMPTTAADYIAVIAQEMGIRRSTLLRGVLLDFIERTREETDYYLDERVPGLE